MRTSWGQVDDKYLCQHMPASFQTLSSLVVDLSWYIAKYICTGLVTKRGSVYFGKFYLFLNPGCSNKNRLVTQFWVKYKNFSWKFSGNIPNPMFFQKIEFPVPFFILWNLIKNSCSPRNFSQDLWSILYTIQISYIQMPYKIYMTILAHLRHRVRH